MRLCRQGAVSRKQHAVLGEILSHIGAAFDLWVEPLQQVGRRRNLLWVQPRQPVEGRRFLDVLYLGYLTCTLPS